MEWTAWEGSMERNWSEPHEYREVYDIGAVAVQRDGFEIANTFRQLVTLELVPELPAYSTNLTSTTQADLDRDGVPFNDAVQSFHTFANDLPMYCWGIDGFHLHENCTLKNVANPFAPEQFHNMRDVFTAYGIPAKDYQSSTIVEYFGEQNPHTAHQGLDDALNIVAALKLLQTHVLN